MMANAMRSQEPELFEKFFDTDTDSGRIMCFLGNLDNERLARFEQITAESESDTIELGITGAPFMMKEMNDRIIPQQIRSLLFAFVLVALRVSLSQRSFGLGLVSIVPILITLVVLFGTMGYARIELSVITGIMSGLTIHTYLTVLMWVTMICGSIVSLTLLPTLLGGRRDRAKR